jgi:predicted PurR-regulated permease PerM
MLTRLTPAKRNTALFVLACLVAWFSWTVRSVLNPLILGYLLAYIVHPMVTRLEVRGWRRRPAVNFIFVTAGLLTVALTLGIFSQGRALIHELAQSQVWERAEARIERGLERLVAIMPDGEVEVPGEEPANEGDGAQEAEGAVTPEPAVTDPAALDPALADALEGEPRVVHLLAEFWSRLEGEQTAGAGKMALQGAGGVWNLLQAWFGSLFGFLTLILLLPIYSYFLLFELDTIHEFVRRYTPVRERERIMRIGGEIGQVLESFFRGRLVVCLMKGGLIATGLMATGFDYALLLGMGSGFLSLVPFAGPLLGFGMAVLVGLLNPDLSVIGMLIRTVAVFGVAEMLEGYVLIPKVLGDSLGLHPVVVLASVFVGGAALGMFGFLIALPLAAVLVILAKEFILPAMAAFADEDDDEDGDAKKTSAQVEVT